MLLDVSFKANAVPNVPSSRYNLYAVISAPLFSDEGYMFTVMVVAVAETKIGAGGASGIDAALTYAIEEY